MNAPSGVVGWLRFIVAFPFTQTGVLLMFFGIWIGDGLNTATAVFLHLQRYNDQ